MTKIIDLRDVKPEYKVCSYENGEWIYKLHFENCTIILSKEQMESIRE